MKMNRFHLTSKLAYIAVRRHVVLQEFDLGKAVAAHCANVLLLLVCVMCLHVQGKILLSIKLFSTLIARIVEVCGMTHFLVF